MNRERLFSASITGTMDVRDRTSVPIEPSDVERLAEAGYMSKDTDTHYVYPGPFHMFAFHLNEQHELTITHFRVLSILAIMCWLYVPLFFLTFGWLAFLAFPFNILVRIAAVAIGTFASLAWTAYLNKYWDKEFDYPQKVREVLEHD